MNRQQRREAKKAQQQHEMSSDDVYISVAVKNGVTEIFMGPAPDMDRWILRFKVPSTNLDGMRLMLDGSQFEAFGGFLSKALDAALLAQTQPDIDPSDFRIVIHMVRDSEKFRRLFTGEEPIEVPVSALGLV